MKQPVQPSKLLQAYKNEGIDPVKDYKESLGKELENAPETFMFSDATPIPSDHNLFSDLKKRAGVAYATDPRSLESSLAEYQTFAGQAFNTLSSSVINGLAGAAEGIGYLLDLPDLFDSKFTGDEQGDDNWFSSAMRDVQDWTRESLPLYRENPDKFFDGTDTASYGIAFRDTISSVLQFAIPGLGITKGFGALGKLARAGKAVQQGMKLTSALATNYIESQVMAVAMREEMFQKLSALRPDLSFEERQRLAAKAGEDLKWANKIMIWQDVFALRGLIGLGNLAKSGKLIKNMKPPSRAKDLMNFGIGSLSEGAEEVFQGVLQSEVEYQNLKNLGVEDKALPSSDISLGRYLSFLANKETIYEGVLGMLGGAMSEALLSPFRPGLTERQESYQKMVDIENETRALVEKQIQDKEQYVSALTEMGLGEEAKDFGFDMVFFDAIKNGKDHIIEDHLGEIQESLEMQLSDPDTENKEVLQQQLDDVKRYKERIPSIKEDLKQVNKVYGGLVDPQVFADLRHHRYLEEKINETVESIDQKTYNEVAQKEKQSFDKRKEREFNAQKATNKSKEIAQLAKDRDLALEEIELKRKDALDKNKDKDSQGVIDKIIQSTKSPESINREYDLKKDKVNNKFNKDKNKVEQKYNDMKFESESLTLTPEKSLYVYTNDSDEMVDRKLAIIEQMEQLDESYKNARNMVVESVDIEEKISLGLSPQAVNAYHSKKLEEIKEGIEKGIQEESQANQQEQAAEEVATPEEFEEAIVQEEEEVVNEVVEEEIQDQDEEPQIPVVEEQEVEEKVEEAETLLEEEEANIYNEIAKALNEEVDDDSFNLEEELNQTQKDFEFVAKMTDLLSRLIDNIQKQKKINPNAKNRYKGINFLDIVDGVYASAANNLKLTPSQFKNHYEVLKMAFNMATHSDPSVRADVEFHKWAMNRHVAISSAEDEQVSMDNRTRMKTLDINEYIKPNDLDDDGMEKLTDMPHSIARLEKGFIEEYDKDGNRTMRERGDTISSLNLKYLSTIDPRILKHNDDLFFLMEGPDSIVYDKKANKNYSGSRVPIKFSEYTAKYNIKEFSKEWYGITPIAIYATINGKLEKIGFIHDINYVSDRRVAESEVKVAKQFDELTALRKKIINNSINNRYTTSKIINISNGHIIINKDNKNRLVANEFTFNEGNNEPILAIAKSASELELTKGKNFRDYDEDIIDHMQGKTKLIYDEDPETGVNRREQRDIEPLHYIPKATYMLVPTRYEGDKVKRTPILLKNKKASKEVMNHVDVLLTAAFTNDTDALNILKDNGFETYNPKDLEHLKNELAKFFYVKVLKDFNFDQMVDQNLFKPNEVRIGMEKDKDGKLSKIIFAHNLNGVLNKVVFEKGKEATREDIINAKIMLGSSYVYTDRTKLNTYNKPIILLNRNAQSPVSKVYTTYNDFIANHTETKAIRINIGTDADPFYIYTIQRTIEFSAYTDTQTSMGSTYSRNRLGKLHKTRSEQHLKTNKEIAKSFSLLGKKGKTNLDDYFTKSQVEILKDSNSIPFITKLMKFSEWSMLTRNRLSEETREFLAEGLDLQNFQQDDFLDTKPKISKFKSFINAILNNEIDIHPVYHYQPGVVDNYIDNIKAKLNTTIPSTELYNLAEELEKNASDNNIKYIEATANLTSKDWFIIDAFNELQTLNANEVSFSELIENNYVVPEKEQKKEAKEEKPKADEAPKEIPKSSGDATDFVKKRKKFASNRLERLKKKKKDDDSYSLEEISNNVSARRTQEIDNAKNKCP